jgi:hypothetical protein
MCEQLNSSHIHSASKTGCAKGRPSPPSAIDLKSAARCYALDLSKNPQAIPGIKTVRCIETGFTFFYRATPLGKAVYAIASGKETRLYTNLVKNENAYCHGKISLKTWVRGANDLGFEITY